jgi:hypothetical protein
MQRGSHGIWFSNWKTGLEFQHFEHGRKESWQTIVKKIRVAVSRVEVNRLQAVKVEKNKKAAAGKGQQGDSKVVRVAGKVTRAKRVVSRATANCDAR